MPVVSDSPASAARAFDLQAEIVAVCANTRSSWPRLAELLYDFYEAKGWEAFGVESFNEWIADPELGLPRRSYLYDLIAIWRELVVRRSVQPAGLVELDATKVAVVLPALRSGRVAWRDAKADCRALSRSDLREAYGTPQTSQDDAWTACPTCKGKGKVRERV